MPRKQSYDGSFEDLPVSIRRALSVDRSWEVDAACRGRGSWPWVAEADRTYLIQGHRYSGVKLIELAMVTCQTCPVQWECAATAIRADEKAAIWGGATADQLAIFRKRAGGVDRAVEILEMGKSSGVTVGRLVLTALGDISWADADLPELQDHQ